MDKIKVLLFAMTGFGNNILKVLKNHPFVKVIGVFTPKKQNSPFPYYECEKLQDIVINSGIVLYEGLVLKEKTTYCLIKNLSPHLIVVSTFNQIIPDAIISIPKRGVINVHPSLLPRYRGATPITWVLINGEKETGVTVHFIEDENIDCGRIITQTKSKIEPSDTDGSLRFKLAKLSEKVLSDALNLILTKERKEFPLQDESQASYYPKRTLKDAEVDLDKPFKDIQNKIRAMNPYPGAYLNYNSIKYIVRGATLLNGKNIGGSSKIYGQELIVKTREGIVKFYIGKKENNGR